MKKTTIVLVATVCLLFIYAYPAPAAAGHDFHRGFLCKNKVKVMTRNLYLGADIFKVLEAAQNPDPNLGGLDVPIAVAELFQTVQYTNFLERAEAIAREIWITRPHLIGLQEVSSWYTQSPSDFFDFSSGSPVPDPDQEPAEEPVYDYLTILLEALQARGLHYEVAVSVTNAILELPMLTGFNTIPGYPGPVPTFDDLLMVDHDVILVRTDVDTSNPMAANYSHYLSETIGGVELDFTRGWTAVDADVCGDTYRFVNTHLEIASDPESIFRVIQAAQMQELLTILSYETNPILLVGDFNSSPEHVPGDGCLPDESACFEYVPPYQQATMYAGYLDAWDLIFWPRDGFTDSFDEFLSDPNAELTERIDLVLLKPQDKVIKRVAGMTTGDKPFSMTPSGLWPSDHAGVVMRIKFTTPE
ncbi:endonuclease/exonuclease/phosphatase family protein [bacterium]|nr:endonuclease/exonuclease/phosphatase family protein [bacterium]